MKAIHQLSTFQNILKQYPLDQPLHRFLTTYYRQNKQMGSKDRRIASRLIYNYFRLGKALANQSPEERLAVAEFLCSKNTNDFIAHFKPAWDTLVALPIVDKLATVKAEYADFNLQEVFPFQKHISDRVDLEAFYQSFFIQPDLFIRLQRGQEKRIIKLLNDANISFTQISPQILAFANGTKLDEVLTDKGIYEVQDLSSQKVCTFFKPQKWDKWWDCCAASGGKSLFLYDEEPTVKLLVSDNRDTILDNLKERFSLAKITNYQRKVLDLTLNQDLFLHDYEFDGIILDAPCSGSGTWGRTPEMITQTEEYKIKFYTDLQRKIATNVVKYLKVGKPLIYITCSVFKAENEEQVEWMCKQFDLQIENQQLIIGYQDKADTLFVAKLIK